MADIFLDELSGLVTNESSSDSHFYGQVTSINADGSYQVKLGSSSTTTRCAKLTHAAVGDVVLVVILRSGQCAVLGVVGGGGSMSLPVAISDGGTGATTAAVARQNINFIGNNPVTLETDTTATWMDLGTGLAYFFTNGLITDQPSRYGFITNFSQTSNVFQMWHTQGQGLTYIRSGNANGWAMTWKAIPQIDLLWTNSSPTSSFSAQTVSVSLSGYNQALIMFNQTTSESTDGVSAIGEVGRSLYPVSPYNSGNVVIRKTTVKSSSVVFGRCLENGVGYHDDRLIPYKIYGIKGVN